MQIKNFLLFIGILFSIGATGQKIILPQVKVSQEDNAKPMQLQDLSVDI
ncbi:MAG: trypsin, partial [Capnocytophaga sp.]